AALRARSSDARGTVAPSPFPEAARRRRAARAPESWLRWRAPHVYTLDRAPPARNAVARAHDEPSLPLTWHSLRLCCGALEVGPSTLPSLTLGRIVGQ